MSTITIAGIAGSLRRSSLNRGLLHAAAEGLPAGVELRIWEGLGDVPPFNEDLESGPVPAAVAELRELVATADALFIATPEYNGGLPGQLKNALDWASRPQGDCVLSGTLAATASVSPTPYGAVWAQEQLRKALTLSGAEVIGEELVVADAYQRFDDDGHLLEEELRRRLAGLVAELAHHAASDRVRA